MSLTVTFLGHACWILNTATHRIIVDPFIKDNSLAPVELSEVGTVDYIFVTHAHWDHLGDTVELAKASDALVVSTAEVAGMVGEKGVRTHGMHVGGTFTFDFGTARVFPAFHGSGVPGGHAAGFVFDTPEGIVYHAGDTSLFGDMQLLDGVVVDHIDLALLPIGSNFTMGIDDAVIATRWINPRVVIPMHYDTFPAIEADPRGFRTQVEATTSSRVVILRPGQSFELS